MRLRPPWITLYTRGRAPGASVVLATQRPSALPETAISQSDLVVAHRLTSQRDVDALAAMRPTYLSGTVGAKLPSRTGDALVVDDATSNVVEATEDTSTATETGTATETETGTTEDGETGNGIPGFGMGIALIAVLGAALLALRQN